MSDFSRQIADTTEVRHHNGQCEYGDWLPADDGRVPEWVLSAVCDEVAGAECRSMRREPPQANTEDGGTVEQGGSRWVYRR